jgi:predicted HTH transcriptional regulator
MNIDLSDENIVLRLSNLEDSFVERKTEGDSADWLKTVVAFANSLPYGYPAILFIGVKNDGSIQGLENPDSVQKSLSQKLAQAYPIPYCLTKVLEKEGKKFLAVVVPGSEHRPHFAGAAYVRDGSQTVRASEQQFAILIAQRSSVAYEISKWRGKLVSIWHPGKIGVTYHPTTGYKAEGMISDCNQFFVTLEGSAFSSKVSFGLDAFDIGFDDARNRLELRFRGPFS